MCTRAWYLFKKIIFRAVREADNSLFHHSPSLQNPPVSAHRVFSNIIARLFDVCNHAKRVWPMHVLEERGSQKEGRALCITIPDGRGQANLGKQRNARRRWSLAVNMRCSSVYSANSPLHTVNTLAAASIGRRVYNIHTLYVCMNLWERRCTWPTCEHWKHN